MLRKSGLSVIGALTIVALSACTQTSHSTKPANLGKAISSAAMEALIDQPGPIELETVVGADWIADLSGLLNLKDPKAVEAGLRDHEEPIQIYAHLLRHPTQGFFMVDTGVSKRLVADPASLGVGWVLRTFAKIERMQVRQDTLSVIKSEGVPLKGVFMTHLHLDHISGMPDVPKDVPIYTGPGEPEYSSLVHMFVQGMEDSFLAGRPPLQELQFAKDPDGRLEGVIDVFGDGSFFAIQSPGHTPGSMAFVVRTTAGPVLLTGDTCHTRWGWDNGVEPGSYIDDRERTRKNLLALKALSERHPKMIVKLGHQP
ncbi:MBL fold metallo-hydrolase [Bradyrhizobium cajani]|uniref:MBL fold metallo-hydrolase n=1 Tax=Bradyrhizobium cajani TaxID=1928661 RepID=A0A844T9M9_9BRAD|nr:MBL fold metallo-hydrolase [Bradyrhizobium cajani]MCP3371904.1 MBL fold metallo-hydrolase [Bradyrhizobium cajani]MVT74295.1 MBL fold metallo-hydrolase [Bradyrhizobium cajani]